MASKITITKGKLLKGDKLEVEYLRPDGENKPAEVSEKHSIPPHEDLKIAFESLTLHCIIINEFVEVLQEKHFMEIEERSEAKELEKHHATGFTILNSGDEDTEGVILTCHKTLNTGKMFNYNTPIVYLNKEEDGYLFAEDLKECLKEVRKEIAAYLKGKVAADTQGKLFVDEKKDGDLVLVK